MQYRVCKSEVLFREEKRFNILFPLFYIQVESSETINIYIKIKIFQEISFLQSFFTVLGGNSFKVVSKFRGNSGINAKAFY